MRLYLVQHGDAVSKDVNPERPLSELGAADIGRLATWLGNAGASVAQILHSGKLRAAQTAEILAPVLADGGTLEARNGLAPNDPPQDFLGTLGGEDVLVAGHMPFVSHAVSLALGLAQDHAIVTFKPGSVAILERQDDDSWSLAGFVRPDILSV